MSRHRPLVTWALAATAAVAALAVVVFAEPLARSLLTSGVSVFPGRESAEYYTAQLRRSGLAWFVLLPSLVVLSGVVTRGLVGHNTPGASRPSYAVAVAAVVVLAAAALPRTPTGDEPAYLAMAGSIAHRGSFDVSGGDASLHRSPAARPGENRSVHSVGLPLILAVPALLGGETACRLSTSLLALALLATLATGVSTGSDSDAGRLVLAALACSFPVAAYAALALPEIAGALALWLTYRDAIDGRRASASSALAVALLPWLHVRFVPGAALLAI
ncbi:MAG: hypothetical protein ACOY3Y_10105, partial [Acidobacteriota bacterium]